MKTAKVQNNHFQLVVSCAVPEWKYALISGFQSYEDCQSSKYIISRFPCGGMDVHVFGRWMALHWYMSKSLCSNSDEPGCRSVCFAAHLDYRFLTPQASAHHGPKTLNMSTLSSLDWTSLVGLCLPDLANKSDDFFESFKHYLLTDELVTLNNSYDHLG